MTWYYKDVPIDVLPIDCVGFVYIIECTVNGKKYIGKKTAFFSKTKYKTVVTKSGTKKKKKIREKVDSDWRDYYGSSDHLLADLHSMGVDSFKRSIIHICKSKAEMSYIEAKYQFLYDVLESEDWYNAWISVKVHKKHILGKIVSE